MKLIDLIDYLVEPTKLKELYQQLGLNQSSEAILIYMAEELNVGSDVQLFEIENTDDEILFESDGCRYVQLFPVNFAVRLIDEDLELKSSNLPNVLLAERLIDYCKNDA